MKVSDIFECTFNAIYLICVLGVGIKMLLKRSNIKEYNLFAYMCIILGSGDCFHLIPRMYSKVVGLSDSVVAALGIGNAITGIGMTVFYAIFFEFYCLHYRKDLKTCRIFIYLLFAIRVVCILLPQNDWIHNSRDFTMSLVRNIPFIILGFIVVVLLIISSIKNKDSLRFLWLYVVISFGCYTPVALCNLPTGVNATLMICKTIAYLSMVFTGYLTIQSSSGDSKPKQQ